MILTMHKRYLVESEFQSFLPSRGPHPRPFSTAVEKGARFMKSTGPLRSTRTGRGGREVGAGSSARRAYFMMIFLFALAACGTTSPVTKQQVTKKIVNSSSVANLNKGGVIYTDYSGSLVGRGKSSVLFFFKASDPFSVRNDATIRSVYGSGAAVVTTYRLDFLTSTGARLQYGVLLEDTLVLLDTAGQRVASFIHPSEEEIRIILRGNLPVSPKS